MREETATGILKFGAWISQQAKVVDLGKLGKDLTTQDHVVILP
jgi:hypothetical protein